MAYQVPKLEPESFVLGTTLKFTKNLPNYLPDTWTLSYALVNSSNQITFTASDNGDSTHLINVSASTTSAYTAGTYKWQSYVTDGTDTFAVESGTIEIKTLYSAESTGFDDRDHVKKVLDALEATILGKASKDQLFYMIAGRQISRIPPADLIEWRNFYKAEYNRILKEERIARGLQTSSKIKVRFK